MPRSRPRRSLTGAQVLGVLAFALALFFMISFASKSIEASQLQRWRDRLLDDITEMEREKRVLEARLEYGGSDAYKREVLRDAGMLPKGGVAVMVTVQIAPTYPIATRTPSPGIQVPGAQQLFDNANWQSWIEAVW